MFLAMPLGIDSIAMLKPIGTGGTRRAGRARRPPVSSWPATTQADQGRSGRPHEHYPSDLVHFNNSACKALKYTGDIPTIGSRPRDISRESATTWARVCLGTH